ncbi:MAG: transposase [Acidobacteriota bacterium]
MTRTHACAEGGERALGSIPRNYGSNISVIGAINLQGLVTSMHIEGAVDGLALDCFIEKFLVPELREGQIVIIDNLNIHLSERVEELIRKAKLL